MHKPTHAPTQAPKRTHLRTRANACTQTHAPTQAPKRTHSPKRMHLRTQPYTQPNAHTHARTNACTYARTHAPTQTHAPIYPTKRTHPHSNKTARVTPTAARVNAKCNINLLHDAFIHQLMLRRASTLTAGHLQAARKFYCMCVLCFNLCGGNCAYYYDCCYED